MTRFHVQYDGYVDAVDEKHAAVRAAAHLFNHKPDAEPSAEYRAVIEATAREGKYATGGKA